MTRSAVQTASALGDKVSHSGASIIGARGHSHHSLNYSTWVSADFSSSLEILFWKITSHSLVICRGIFSWKAQPSESDPLASLKAMLQWTPPAFGCGAVTPNVSATKTGSCPVLSFHTLWHFSHRSATLVSMGNVCFVDLMLLCTHPVQSILLSNFRLTFFHVNIKFWLFQVISKSWRNLKCWIACSHQY